MLGPAIDRIADFKFQDVSLGKSLLYFLGLEFAKVLTAALEKFKIPPIATGGGLAYTVRKVGAVRRFLGDTGSDVVSITMIAGGADQQFKLGKIVDAAVAKLAIKAGVMDWQEAMHRGFLTHDEIMALTGMASDEVGHKYEAWLSAQGLAAPLAAPEVAAPVATSKLASPAPEPAASPAPELASPEAELGAAEEYLTSVERKIRAIATK